MSDEMWDEIEIGSVPGLEQGVGNSEKNYNKNAKKEALIFKKQLIRKFGNQEGIEFYIRKIKQSHGIYYNVIMIYKVNDWKSQNFAFLEVEDNIPDFWDDESKKELEKLQKNWETIMIFSIHI